MKFYFLFLALISVVATQSALPSSCGGQREWDPIKKMCLKCSTGSVYNKYTKRCMIITKEPLSCVKGFKYDPVEHECLDIDECNVGIYPCESGKKCLNLNGTFVCKINTMCGFGYRFDNVTQACKDRNECEELKNLCSSKETCVNDPGSFHCRLTCTKEKKHFWRGECHLCEEGFRLNRKTGLCEDVDECAGLLLCSPYREKCVTMPGLSQCVTHCSGGTRALSGKCYDIDECEERSHNCTSDKMCQNFFGTFKCVNPKCKQNAMFNPEENVCTCKTGFKNTRECLDEDECQATPSPCGPFGRCINNPGNFSCICKEGYHFVNGTCEDINECETMKGVCGTLACSNIPGSYKCLCPVGFRIKEYDICEDIDECAQSPNVCRSSSLLFGEAFHCFNLIGSFKCIKSHCPSEYHTIKDGDVIRCELIDGDCSIENNKACLQTLPEEIFFHVVQISKVSSTPYKFATVSLHLPEYDDFHIRIILKKALDTKTGASLDTHSLVSMTYNQDTDKASFYLLRSLTTPTEILCDVYLKYTSQAQQRIKSLHQFHLFANNETP